MKKALSLFLALVLCLSLSLPALAAAPTDADQENAAWTLYHMGLFQGTDTDKEGFPVFSLSDAPTRAQGVTMLVRLLGQEKAALEGAWTTPFTDVPEWAQPYVGYAYEKGLTNGTGETTFSADKTLSATEYLTLVLRALGYDSASDFAWDSAWTLTDKLGITNQVYSAATKDSKETYTNFEVTSATANGVACKIEQYSTPAKVKEQCRKISRREDVTVTLPDAFALVYLSYDEAAAKDAATETVTAHQGTYPVITLKLHCTGTLKDGTKVTELVSMDYYVDNYTGYF